MTMLNPNFVFLSIVIGSFGSFGYLVETLRGRAKPNKVTFLLWSFPALITLIVQVQEKVGIISLMTASMVIVPFLIFLASFVNKKAKWKVTKFDILCGVFSFIGLVFWMITKEGVVAILFSIVADFLAGLPTVIKSYKHPETEVAWAWLLGAIGMVIALLTLPSWTFINSAFFIYGFFFMFLLFVLVQFKIGRKKEA